jgi:hypothetical protein
MIKNKTLMKEIEEDTKNGKTACDHELEETILLKCLCYHKLFINSMKFL